jgi:signal transduction histidine kinase
MINRLAIRWKIILLFFLSAAFSLCVTLILLFVAGVLYRSNFLPAVILLEILEEMVGVIPVISVTAALLFVLFVVLLSWPYIRYLVQITETVKTLSKGRLDVRIPVKTQDELGELAKNINQMAKQLDASIQEERRAVQSKNELITNVSHDLRTPLTSIIGYLQFIDEDRYKDEVELRYYVSIIHEKAKRLHRLIQDLFEYTRMSYGQTVLNRHELDLIELIGQVAAEFSLQLQETGMELNLEAPKEKLLIYADGEKMMRVFENLISNAIKYGQDGKKIRITAEQKEASAVVRVVNYGVPIPAADIPHIFERFYRVEKSRSDETGGTGLGLAIVKSIVELHEGTVTLSSDERQTAFEIKLPLPSS